MDEKLITNARTIDEKNIDILFVNGRIKTITDAGALDGTVDKQYNVNGNLVTPTFTEPHTHIDMALTAGESQWNTDGTLRSGIKIWKEYKSTLDASDVRERAERVINWFATNGVTRIRTHVDTTEETLENISAILDLKDKLPNTIELQIVAFPQDGLLTDPKYETLLREAIEAGADFVGGIPHFEYTSEDGVQAVKTAFDIAERFNCGLDMHIDEIDDPTARFTEVLASETIKRGFQNSVTASHATAMHSYPNAYASKLIEMLAASGVSVITNPLDNAVLQGRHDDYPRRRGHTRIDELRKAGVPVGIGHDSVMDPVYHYGCADPIDAAYVLIHYAHMSGHDDVEILWQMLTETNAEIFGVAPHEYGLKEGNEASFIVFDAKTPFDVLRTRAARKLVFSHGKLIAQSKRDTEVDLDGGVIAFD